MTDIELLGVRTHNLKDLDARFPLGAITAVTGVSGSGKSSLVFDTLYGESYCRYIENLSSFARQYMQVMPRPVLDEVRNLPAAIAVKQNRGQASVRSTVGSMSELADYLGLIFAYAGQVFCPNGHGEVHAYDGGQIYEDLLIRCPGRKIMVLAPLDRWRGMKPDELRKQLEIQGFVRVLVAGTVRKLADVSADEIKASSLIIDRVTVDLADKERLIQSCALAMRVSREKVDVVDADDTRTIHRYFGEMICPSCHEKLSPPTPVLFNPNSPHGACKNCQGFGREAILDRSKIIPDLSKSLEGEGVQCWHFGQHKAYFASAIKAAKTVGISPAKRFADYTDTDWEFLFRGRKGTGFTGIEGYFAILDRKKYRAHYRIHASRFRRYVPCRECLGDRLNGHARSVLVFGMSFGELLKLPVERILELLSVKGADLKVTHLSEVSALGLGDVVEEAQARLRYLVEVGLGYLNLTRTSSSLSGGELQRLQMARGLGNSLTGTLFCLDEPSAGLHAEDSARLVRFLKKIAEQGNSIVMVEHESVLIQMADKVCELGPEAGAKGGQIVYEGPPKASSSFSFSRRRRQEFSEFIELSEVATHNLKSVHVRIPVGAITCVAGVSGSGKTSLVRHTLYPLGLSLTDSAGAGSEVELHGTLNPLPKGAFDRVLLVGQEPLARSSRSNIGTYLGLFSEIRKIFASLPKAQGMGLKPGHFSFNIPGGRCETCQGLGSVMEDLSFLGEVSVICATCEGRRFLDHVLEVRYKNLNFGDILELTISDAREFFFDQPALTRIFDEVIAVGLGYLTLGQPTSSFSGGEAQRLKLLGLQKEIRSHSRYLLMIDEPTSGLSDQDVVVLLNQFNILRSKGHTIVLVEHHLGVIKSADWVIELGPGAGERGGEIIYMGEPEGLLLAERSRTRPFLLQ